MRSLPNAPQTNAAGVLVACRNSEHGFPRFCCIRGMFESARFESSYRTGIISSGLVDAKAYASVTLDCFLIGDR